MTPPTSEEVIWHWLREGWKYRRFGQLSPALRAEYSERVKYEMNLIVDKDFVDYFLMLSDAIRATKDAGIPVGPARGSAAASLVCYLLRITEVNPMDYPLMIFERFIDPNRHDLPDVDVDFDDEKRDFARQYMIEKYGEDRVGNIGTFTRYRGKNALDDVARVYEIPKYEIERAKDFLVERSGGDTRFDAGIQDTVDMFPAVKEIFDRHPLLYRAMTLEGNLKGFGVHAAGIVVGAEDLSNYVATYEREVGKHKNKVQVLSVDKYDGEHLGLLKLDALGLSTMGMLRHCLEFTGMSLEELYAIPMDDEASLEAFGRADVTGIFQFEGRTMRMVCQEMVPKNFMDLSAINALSRPGPLHSGTTGDYIAIRHGRMERVSLHPRIDEICVATEGQIIYQEQILQITRDLGNFPWTHAAAIRKIISNRQGENAFNAMWDIFLAGTAENGISEETAREIWRKIVTAGAYAFNIAHCVSYSVLGMWAMYFKTHYPREFYAAQLRKNEKDKEVALLRDMQDVRFGRNYQVLPPSITESGVTWGVAKDRVREGFNKGGVLAGFQQIPGIGEKTAEAIVAQRDSAEPGMFEVWDHLIQVKGIGPATMAKIRDFAEHDDPFKINWIKNASEGIRKWTRDEMSAARQSGYSSFDIGAMGLPQLQDTFSDEIPYEDKASQHVVMGVLKARNLQDLYENHRSRTGEDLDPKTVKDPDLKDSMTLYLEDEHGLITLKVSRWLYPKMKGDLWSATVGHDFIVARCKKRPFFGKTVHVVPNGLWVVDPD